MITIADLQPKPRMSEEEYDLFKVRSALQHDPAFALSQARHYQHLASLWHERMREDMDHSGEPRYRDSFLIAAVAKQAASARCYRLARLYAGIE